MILQLTFSVFILIIFSEGVIARPYKDSPIQTIIVPYQARVVKGHPYQFPKAVGESRHVLVPVTMDMVPNFNLDQSNVAMVNGKESMNIKGMPVNFVDGAYPVYYMPGNANGKFNGKISLLT